MISEFNNLLSSRLLTSSRSLQTYLSMASFSISKFSNEDLADTMRLMEVYAASLGIDLAFQEIDTEMASMPGKYTPPTGALLIARNTAGDAIGCVALRQLDDEGFCEIKRLYVDPKGRGLGVGKALAIAIIKEAERLNYKAIRLDTLPSMAAAKGLYKSLGFTKTTPYYDTPIPDTLFLELQLHT